jgi:hypothetical protein
MEIYALFLMLVGVPVEICEKIIECLENDEATRTAFEVAMRELGFDQSASVDTDNPAPVVPVGSSAATDSILPDDYDCSTPEHNMSIARNIVQSVNRAITDFLEVIELVTNPQELATELSDNVEGVSLIVGSFLEVGAWLQDTVAEFYSASYTEEAEDELACAIFCYLEENCSLSWNELLAIYETEATITLPNTDDLFEILNFFVELALTIDTTTVAVIHYWVLQMMRWGRAFNWSGVGSFQSDIAAWSRDWDFTYDDCDCTEDSPLTYWYLEGNFQVSSNGWFMQNGTGRDGGGIIGVSSGGNLRVTMRYPDLGASYTLEQFAVLNQRQATGGTPSGTDTDASATWPNANYTGTAAQNGTQAFKARNDNSVFGTWTGTVAGKRSLQFDSIFWNTPTEKRFRMRRAAIWGLPASGVKPPGSIWVANLNTDIFSRGD